MPHDRLHNLRRRASMHRRAQVQRVKTGADDPCWMRPRPTLFRTRVTRFEAFQLSSRLTNFPEQMTGPPTSWPFVPGPGACVVALATKGTRREDDPRFPIGTTVAYIRLVWSPQSGKRTCLI